MAAPRLGDMVRYRFDLKMGIVGGAGQRTASHHSHIRPVIAHGRRLTPVQPQRSEGLLRGGALFFNAIVHMFNTQRGKAQAQWF